MSFNSNGYLVETPYFIADSPTLIDRDGMFATRGAASFSGSSVFLPTLPLASANAISRALPNDFFRWTSGRVAIPS